MSTSRGCTGVLDGGEIFNPLSFFNSGLNQVCLIHLMSFVDGHHFHHLRMLANDRAMSRPIGICGESGGRLSGGTKRV
jgi:hypothetical protein